MFSTLSDTEVEILGRGVGTILEKQGFYCENRDRLAAWRQAGAQVDFEAQVAKARRALCR
jgi:trimethylamine:corrinoid methyltransferase-like protein